jgi:hypothetical protein
MTRDGRIVQENPASAFESFSIPARKHSSTNRDDTFAMVAEWTTRFNA